MRAPRDRPCLRRLSCANKVIAAVTRSIATAKQGCQIRHESVSAGSCPVGLPCIAMRHPLHLQSAAPTEFAALRHSVILLPMHHARGNFLHRGAEENCGNSLTRLTSAPMYHAHNMRSPCRAPLMRCHAFQPWMQKHASTMRQDRDRENTGARISAGFGITPGAGAVPYWRPSVQPP